MVSRELAEVLQSNLHDVQTEVRQCAVACGRDPTEIVLVAVSKTRSLDEVDAVADCGQIAFGENTLQDALSKIPHTVRKDLEWHFIGHLQSKKSARVVENFSWIHTVDSLKLARKLSSAISLHSPDKVLNCLLQVNVSGDSGKSGLAPGQVKPLLAQLLDAELPGLVWRGLMTIGVQADQQQTAEVFASLRNMQQQCQQEFNLPAFDQLSMGMSGDYCLAIEQGATMIRVGSLIFGNRVKR